MTKRFFNRITLIAIASALALLAFGCANGSTAVTTGAIKGVAHFSGLADNSGILVTADRTVSGRTAKVLSMLGLEAGSARAIAAQATTDASGAYTLGELPAGTYTVYASSKVSLEKAVATNVIVEAGKDTTANDLQLTPTGSVSGKATLAGSASGNLGICVFIAGTSYVAMTDASGAYKIEDVPIGTGYALVAKLGDSSANTTVSVSAGADTKASDLTLSPSGSVSGKATLAGAASGNLGISVFIAGTSLSAMTDDSGAYLIDDVPAGTGYVLVAKLGSASASETISVAAGARTAASLLTLAQPGSITGTATIAGAASGNQGILVYIPGSSYSTLTDDAGAFTLSGLPAKADYTLYAERGDYDASATVSVSEGGTTTQNLSLVVLPRMKFGMTLQIDASDLGKTIPSIWENGAISLLSLQSSTATYQYGGVQSGLWTIGGHTYTVGHTMVSNTAYSSHIPVYWKDGVLQELPLPDSHCYGDANGLETDSNGGIFIRSNLVSASSNLSIPAYWSSDGTSVFSCTVLTLGTASEGGFGETAKRMPDGSILVGGWLRNTNADPQIPVYWTNGVLHSLPFTGYVGGSVTSLSLSGSTIYLMGVLIDHNADNCPVYWTMAVGSSSTSDPIRISMSGLSANGFAWGPETLGSDLYAFGIVGRWGNQIPAYWKNWEIQELLMPAGAVYGSSSWADVYGNDFYVWGNLSSASGLGIPVVWKNGKPVILNIGSYPGASSS